MLDVIAQVTSLEEAAGADSLTLDSAILGEQFYFWTVVLMWLIHAGFMSYEAGVVRRKNVMATAMKNILTIAAVTPTFYYFGWWIYNCNQPGLPIGPNSTDFTAAACQGGIPWSDAFGPNLTNNINLIFFLAFLLFSWTAASIMSGALLERVRLPGRLADRFLSNPKEVSVSPPASAGTNIVQGLSVVPEAEKREALRRLIKSQDVKNAIVFCNRKRDVATLHKSLLKHGFPAVALHGDMDQYARMAALES